MCGVMMTMTHIHCYYITKILSLDTKYQNMRADSVCRSLSRITFRWAITFIIIVIIVAIIIIMIIITINGVFSMNRTERLFFIFYLSLSLFFSRLWWIYRKTNAYEIVSCNMIQFLYVFVYLYILYGSLCVVDVLVCKSYSIGATYKCFFSPFVIDETFAWKT